MDSVSDTELNLTYLTDAFSHLKTNVPKTAFDDVKYKKS